MSFLTKAKTTLILSIMKKQRTKPFNYCEADLFELPADAPSFVNNSYYFGGYSVDGQCMTMRLAFRNGENAEIFFIYTDAQGWHLVCDKQEYPSDACPMKVRNLIPARDWQVSYDGDLIDVNDGSTHHIKVDFRFTARLPIVNPPMDSDLKGMASAFAKVKWDRDFFRRLGGDTGLGEEAKKYKQLHYEQTGYMEGTMVIDGRSSEFRLAGVRDRAWGKRDWNYMDCHMWLIAVTANGEVMNLSIVSYPHAKNLHYGYMDYEEDRNFALTGYKIISYDHCDGKGPEEMVIDCSFANGKTYRLKTHREHDLVTPFDGGNFYFHEALGRFTFTETSSLGKEPEDGAHTIDAYGTIELGFNKDASRWGSYEN